MSSNLSRRDRMIAAIGGVVVLYALAGGLWFMSSGHRQVIPDPYSQTVYPEPQRQPWRD